MSQCGVVAGAFLAIATISCGASAQERLAYFVFDQSLDALVRIEDIDGDGDTLDAGEVTLFFGAAVPITGTGNSQGLLALDPYTILATDNFAPDNVVLLTDVNQDGDALDANESAVFWSGAIPAGSGMLTNPVCLSRGPGDALYVIDNNTLDTSNPEAVYRIIDLNGDDDVDDPMEVTQYFEISPAGTSAATTFDIEFDASGAGYVIDITDPNQIESVDRIDPSATTRTEWVDSADLFANTGFLIAGVFELSYLPDTDEIVIQASDLPGNTHLLALRDRNGSGVIDALNEVRVLWSEATNADGHDAGSARDFVWVSDGSLVFIDNSNNRKEVVRLIDRNGDGDYNDVNETNVVYNAAAAGMAGQVAMEQLLSVSAVVVPSDCPADLDGDGTVGSADLAILLGNWGGPGAGDLDGSMTVGSEDLATLLGEWVPCD